MRWGGHVQLLSGGDPGRADCEYHRDGPGRRRGVAAYAVFVAAHRHAVHRRPWHDLGDRYVGLHAGRPGFPPQLAGNIQATVPITWNNGDVSVVSVDVTAVGPIPVVTATISSGAMQGSTGTGVPALTALTGNCLLTPVTSLSLAGVAVAIRG